VKRYSAFEACRKELERAGGKELSKELGELFPKKHSSLGDMFGSVASDKTVEDRAAKLGGWLRAGLAACANPADSFPAAVLQAFLARDDSDAAHARALVPSLRAALIAAGPAALPVATPKKAVKSSPPPPCSFVWRTTNGVYRGVQ
jgi:hypothetical protein